MVTLPIYDLKGAEVGSIDVDPSAIAPKVNKQLLHDAVVMYLANLRQGTKKTKGRGEVSGSTKKLYRQKGTGNARVGSRRAPQRRGGGHAMQLRPRSFYYRLPRKALQAATKMAIASKFTDGEVVVIDKLDMTAPKTKEFAAVMKALKLEGVTTVIATAEYSSNLVLSARNVPGVEVTRVADLNAYAVLKPKRMLLTKDAVEAIKAKTTEVSAA